MLFSVISWIVSSAAKRTIHEVTRTNTNEIFTQLELPNKPSNKPTESLPVTYPLALMLYAVPAISFRGSRSWKTNGIRLQGSASVGCQSDCLSYSALCRIVRAMFEGLYPKRPLIKPNVSLFDSDWRFFRGGAQVLSRRNSTTQNGGSSIYRTTGALRICQVQTRHSIPTRSVR